MPRSKMSHAIALAIGLSAVSLQVSAQSHVSSNQNSPINSGTGTSVIVDPNVTVTVNRMSLTDGFGNPIYAGHGASVSGTGSIAMTTGSRLNFDSAGMVGANHAVNVASGSFTAVGSGITAQGAGSSALNASGGSANLVGSTLNTTGANAAGVSLSGGATVSLTGVNLHTSGTGAHAVLITGGAPASTLVIDSSALSMQDTNADIIRANGGAADITIRNGTNLNINGNLLNLQNGSVVKLVADGVNIKGNLISDSASTGRVFLQNGTTLTGMVDPMSMTVDSTSAWNVTADSDLTSLTLNGGTVNFLAPSGNAFKTIVTGSLDGTAGLLSMNTKLGGSASPTDLLHVTGNAGGAHLVRIINAGGRGARTQGDGIRVVQIDGTSPADNFKLIGGPLEAGAYEYFLNQGGQNRPADWYLRSTFRAAVPGYMMTPGLNQDYGYAIIGSLQERIGDFGNPARAEKKTQDENGVWGRIQGSQFNQDAHDNLSTSAHTTFMQFGKDWTLASNPDGSSTHAGATVTLGETNARFYDDLRTVLKAPNGNNTGDVKTRAYSAGGYWTGYHADGGYLDLNGQLTWYQNNYKDIYGRMAANKAVGMALSAEAGQPFAVGGSSLRVEPQVQLTYQYLNSKSFSDYMSAISVKGNHGARGRVGVRLFREMADGDMPLAAAPYLTLDLLRNFLNPATVTVGDEALQANSNKTWGEIGTGITGRVSKQGQLSAALKYRHQLSGQGNEGVAGQVAYRYNW